MQTLEDMAAAVGTKQPAPPAAPQSPAEQIVAYATKRERERLQRRQEIKDGVQRRDALMAELDDIQLQLKLLDTKADAAASEHATKAEPVQKKLKDATGETRVQLLGKVQDMNIELERLLQAIDKCRAPLRKRWEAVRLEAAQIPTEQRLAGEDLADPRLLVEKFVLDRRLAAAQARCEAAADWVHRLEELVQQARTTQVVVDETGWAKVGGKRSLDFAGIHQLTHRLNRWKAESLDAEAEAAACLKEQAELLARMVAE